MNLGRKEFRRKKPKFQKYDLVQIVKKMPHHMNHFTCDCRAIVTEVDDDFNSYGLYLEKTRDEALWYEERQLTLIKRKQSGLLKKWENEEKKKEKQQSNINWISKNGMRVLSEINCYTIQTLAKNLGMDNLWGTHGEGFVYYLNSKMILYLARPYLEKADKSGWVEACKEYKKHKIAIDGEIPY